jgi:hypothetical protein
VRDFVLAEISAAMRENIEREHREKERERERERERREKREKRERAKAREGGRNKKTGALDATACDLGQVRHFVLVASITPW